MIGALIDVHRALGPGLLESAYEACVCRELGLREMNFERQVEVPLHYKGVRVDCGYRMDLVVEGRFVIELKAVEALTNVHAAQILTYMKLSGTRVGLLVNFNAASLRNGLRRYELPSRKPEPPPGSPLLIF
ncbi:MAG TPA: GxxExxY protein [Polyangiaceae bacterium]